MTMMMMMDNDSGGNPLPSSLLNILHCTGQPDNKESPSQNARSAEAEKPWFALSSVSSAMRNPVLFSHNHNIDTM